MFGYDWPRMHAVLNDLPAALLLMAVVFEIAAAVTKRPGHRSAGFWTLIAGTVGGVAAVISGLQAEEHIAHGEAVHELMETHERLALITLGIFAVVALWRIARDARMGSGERVASLAVSVAGAGLLLATGMYGGKLVFDHAAGIPTPVLQAEMHERSEGHHHHGGAEGAEGGEAEHDHDDDHDHLAPAGAVDSAAPASAAEPAGHTHAPGTPPHKD